MTLESQILRKVIARDQEAMRSTPTYEMGMPIGLLPIASSTAMTAILPWHGDRFAVCEARPDCSRLKSISAALVECTKPVTAFVING